MAMMLKRTLCLATIAVALFGCRKTTIIAATTPRVRQVTTTAAPAIKDDRNAKINTVIDPTAPPTFVDKTSIGSRIAADGTVAAQTTDFKVGEPAFLTMRFTKSPQGLRSSVRILDDARKQVHTEWKDMNGASVVTFRLPALKPHDRFTTRFLPMKSAA